ncbi:hypothetical protein [Sphingomonas sp.]|uniref:hypothetical protein n=1 Tax=Sphingomonas sp. TaxID=28214 RepID=UPI001B1945C8|nr:hypothetical protein [Sphingomonas sp.]MBO9713150.1 hypothetical protein [Sphingomonas sp.]
MFPRIERTCPYLDRLDSVMDGDFCRMCERQVHDLTDMTRAERADFLRACGGDACVRYTTYLKPAVAAAMLAASTAALATPAMAQDGRGKPGAHVRKPAIVKPPLVRRVKPPRELLVPMVTAGLPPPPEPPKPAEPPLEPPPATPARP